MRPLSCARLLYCFIALFSFASYAPASAEDFSECQSNSGGAGANALFGNQKRAISLRNGRPMAIGGHHCGCLSGGKELPVEFADDAKGQWQVVQPQRRRHWGHPVLISYVQDLAQRSWTVRRGLLIGDMSMPAGGPFSKGHDSHQQGLEIDIPFSPMPPHRLTPDERAAPFQKGVIKTMLLRRKPGDSPIVNTVLFDGPTVTLLRMAAEDTRVLAIFVNPLIKRHLCDAFPSEKAFLSKLRPARGHDAHFHVRLKCSAKDAAEPEGCRQPPNNFGPDCGEDLDKKVRAAAADLFENGREAAGAIRNIALFPLRCQSLVKWSQP